MEKKIYKIGLIGSAGLGKSNAASKIEKEFGLTFLKSKDITRPFLIEYGYDRNKNQYVESFLSKKEIEFEIIDKKINHENMIANGFITDRTTLECFAYALLSEENYFLDELCLLERICRNNMSKYTDLFYFPFGKGWLEDNGVRTVNSYFQWKIDMIIRGLIKDWELPVTVIDTDNPVEKIRSVLKS